MSEDYKELADEVRASLQLINKVEIGMVLLPKCADALDEQRREIETLTTARNFHFEAANKYCAEVEEFKDIRDALVKERDALRAFIELESEQCTKSHVGGPCGQCRDRLHALAKQPPSE